MTPAQFTPRERIGPRIGVNFVGTPDTRITWANQINTLQAR